MVYRYGKRRFVIIGVLRHHRSKLQLVHDLGRRRHTNQAAGIFCHKVYCLGGAQLGRHNQVAFVLSVLIVSHQNHFTGLYRLDSLVNCIEFKIFHFHSLPF